jgi:hypothetical protein
VKLAGKSRNVFHEYEYKIKDGPILEGRLDALIPNSLKTDRSRVIINGEEVAEPKVKVLVNRVTFRVFPEEKPKPYIDVFVQGTRCETGGADMHPILVHELDIRRTLLEQFLASHPEYWS